MGTIFGDGTYDFSGVCWKQAYNRGSGRVPSACPEGWEKKGAVCLLKCDDPRSCCVTQENRKRNQLDHDESQTCHSDGYAICKQRCENGWRDSGLHCWKNGEPTYTKYSCSRLNTSKRPTCPPELTSHQGLCYKFCPKNTNGIGPLCWMTCKGNSQYPASQGALCCETPERCAEVTTGIVALFGNKFKECFLDHKMNLTACLKDFAFIQQKLTEIQRCQIEFEFETDDYEKLNEQVEADTDDLLQNEALVSGNRSGYDYLVDNNGLGQYYFYNVHSDRYAIYEPLNEDDIPAYVKA